MGASVCYFTEHATLKVDDNGMGVKASNHNTDDTGESIIVPECPEREFKNVSFNPQLPVIYTYSADPDQTSRSAASDLSLYCLPMSQMFQSRFYR